jgi:predicted  nucleic acid-binding Zn-ribbon protein
MALIICPECGKEISNLAEICPNCGCPKVHFSNNIPEETNDVISTENEKADLEIQEESNLVSEKTDSKVQEESYPTVNMPTQKKKSKI